MTRLQSVQNAAVRLVSGAWRSDHITPVLHQLQWLPVPKRGDFKMATLVYRSLSGMAPTSLAAPVFHLDISWGEFFPPEMTISSPPETPFF